ncbi:FAD-dependent oxidoreductase [Micromonospora sp. WMMB482]|uniref:FAD-dependent oxidoreductase n=1 Tax=Micromonospora sp. WMMB482 TaxID=2849653 RepID=UPI0035B21A87
MPRASGEVVVGATVEERADTAVTAGGVLTLLRAAAELVPELVEYELVEAVAGLRPGTPDNAPIIGPLPGRPGVLAATGTTATASCSPRSPPAWSPS